MAAPFSAQAPNDMLNSLTEQEMNDFLSGFVTDRDWLENMPASMRTDSNTYQGTPSTQEQSSLVSSLPLAAPFTPLQPPGAVQCFEHGCNGRAFSCVENYRRHIRERDPSKSVACPFCSLRFSRKSNLKVHLANGKCKGFQTEGEAEPSLDHGAQELGRNPCGDTVDTDDGHDLHATPAAHCHHPHPHTPPMTATSGTHTYILTCIYVNPDQSVSGVGTNCIRDCPLLAMPRQVALPCRDR